MIQILFATRNPKTAFLFKEKLFENETDNLKAFQCECYTSKDNKTFIIDQDVRELLQEVEAIYIQNSLSNLIVILDYHSLWEDFLKLDPEKNRISPIAELFLSYPELKIWIYKEGDKKRRLFGYEDEDTGRYPFIIKSSEDLKNMGEVIHAYQQLFDPSGIRAFLRDKLTRQLIKFKQDNYENLHESRKKNIAIVVDEEQYHTNLWGYALYDFGYSVIPVNYEKELIETKAILYTDQNEEAAINAYKPLIIRDFDLQFPDLGASKINFCGLCKEENEMAYKDCADSNIYAFRGVYNYKKARPENNVKENIINNEKAKNDLCMLHDCRKAFWNTLHDATTYIITQNTPYNPFNKLQNGMVLTKPDESTFFNRVSKRLQQRIVNKRMVGIINQPLIEDSEAENALVQSSGLLFQKANNKSNHGGKYFLVGLSKEIEGMYDLLNMPAYGNDQNNIIKQTYQNSRDYREILKDRQDMDSHSIPPLNRCIVDRLIKKAKSYYETKQYLLAAINASEALEVLNGLAKSLAYEALHLKVVSEVQMELRIKGVGAFKQVLKERINNIHRQKKRLAGDNKEAERNITMQIFNDLRVIYETNEQFGAADDAFAVAKKAEIGLKGSLELRHEKNRMQQELFTKSIKNDKNRTMLHFKNILLADLKYCINFFRKGINLLILAPLLFTAVMMFIFRNDYEKLIDCEWIYGVTAFFVIAPFVFYFDKMIYYLVRTGTSVGRLAFTFLLLNVYLIIAYDPSIIINLGSYNWMKLPDVFMTSLMNEPIEGLLINYEGTKNSGYRMLLTSHVLISVIFLGIFISAMYRKFVRR